MRMVTSTGASQLKACLKLNTIHEINRIKERFNEVRCFTPSSILPSHPALPSSPAALLYVSYFIIEKKNLSIHLYIYIYIVKLFSEFNKKQGCLGIELLLRLLMHYYLFEKWLMELRFITRYFWSEKISREAFKWNRYWKSVTVFLEKSEEVKNILKKRYDRIGI